MDGDVEMRHRGERGGKRYRRQKGLAMGGRDVEMHDAEASLQKNNAGYAFVLLIKSGVTLTLIAITIAPHVCRLHSACSDEYRADPSMRLTCV